MPRLRVVRARLGALALGLSALLLTVFPLVRPFFPLDPTSPDETLALASPSGRALRALAWSLAGITLIMPMLGVETHILPIVGRLNLAGTTAIAPAVGCSRFRG